MAFISSTPLLSDHRTFNSATSLRSHPRTTTTIRRNTRVPIVAVSEPVSKPITNPSSHQAPKLPFNWIEQWYPVAYASDVPDDKPFAFTLWDTKLILYRDVRAGFVVMEDRCPHRLAPLSEGRLFTRNAEDSGEEETVLQCTYHGWCFNCSGTCVDIPTQPKGRRIPSVANVSKTYATHVAFKGLVMVWYGDPNTADVSKIRFPEQIRSADPERILYYRDFPRKLPLDMITNMENVVDPAHVQFAHHGTGQGRREWMSRFSGMTLFPVEDEDHLCAKIIRARPDEDADVFYRTEINFYAPSLISYYTPGHKTGEDVLLALIRPVSRSSSVLFALKATLNYTVWKNWRQLLTPRWVEHITGNLILDGDALMLQGQELNIQNEKAAGYSGWKKNYVCVGGTWDSAVLALRKWVDANSSSMPYATGAGYNADTKASRLVAQDRYEGHTKNCSSCRVALRNFRILRMLMYVSAGISAVFCIVSGMLSVALRNSVTEYRPNSLIASGACFVLVCLLVARIAHHFVQMFIYTDRAQKLLLSD